MERIAKPARRLGTGLLATGIAGCLILMVSVVAFASKVHVYDQAGVLNASQVQSAAQSLPYPMDIYTTNTYNGNSSSFIQQTRSHITSANLIVMAIDTRHHYLAIEGGSSVPLSNSQYSSAVNAFTSNYNSGGYTGATIAAINSLRSSLGSSSSSSSGAPASSGGWNFGLGTLCCVGLLILAAIALFSIFRRRRRGFFGQPQPPMGGPYQQGYPPNYYGPGYNQGSGINPWVAGGLGAAAGGLAGYELGKQAGEREGQGGNPGNEGNFGGGAAGSFGNDDFGGGGAGGDFGGNDSFGAGGGAGGDFGGAGGGDFGGGGGGSF